MCQWFLTVPGSQQHLASVGRGGMGFFTARLCSCCPICRDAFILHLASRWIRVQADWRCSEGQKEAQRTIYEWAAPKKLLAAEAASNLISYISVIYCTTTNRGNIYHLKYARNVIKISTLFVMTSSYKCCVSYFLNIKIWFFPLHISVMGYLSIHTHTLWASHRIHEDSEPVSSHKSFCSILLKQIFSPNGKREKRAKDERKGCFSPPTDSFSSRMILIMNGCPEEDEKRRRRRRRAEKRRIEREGWKEEKSGRSEAEECSPLGAHER